MTDPTNTTDTTDTAATVARNRARQTEWYGEPLGERFRRLLDRLDVSQAALADALGLSAPMLSQLMSGHRAKISNPAVLSRLLAIEAFAAEPGFDRLPSSAVRDRLASVREETATTTSATRIPASPPTEITAAPGADPVVAVQALLRAVASAAEIAAAADLLDIDYPDLAELLRVYGTGRTTDARAHLARTLGADR